MAGDSGRATDLPSFGRVGYVAASDSEIALVKLVRALGGSLV